MAKPRSIYRRLTGRRRTLLGFSQLWIAPDHILLMKSTRFSEQYQHFALGDIQAIVVSALPDRTPLQIAMAAGSILWALIFLSVDSTFARGFFLFTGTIALALTIADIARGPRCRCYLYTAVSRELLAPVSRLRTARAFLDRMRPAIEAVQGSLPAEFQADAVLVPVIDHPPEISRAPGYLPEILFGLFLADAALIVIGHRFPRTDTGGILFTTLLAEVVILIAAIFQALPRRGRRDPRRMIYILMAASVLCIAWDAFGIARGIANWMGSIVEASQRGLAVPPTPSIDKVFERKALFFAAGWRFAMGAIGLVVARFERK